MTTAATSSMALNDAKGIDWRRAALMMVGALALASGIAVVDARLVGVVHDDAMYVILARSLASGEGYRYLNLPGAPAATHFPPGYPALLAMVSWIAPAFPASVVVFKALNAVFLAAAAVLLVRFAQARAMGARWAIALGAASAVSVPLLVLGSMVLSEPFFLAVLLLLLPALESLAERPASVRQALLLGVAIGLCTLVRSHGIVLVPAVAIVLGWRGRWRDAALVSGAAVVTLLPWQVWSAVHSGTLPAPLLGNYDTYTSWWVRGVRLSGIGMVGDTLARTVPEVLEMLAVLFSPLRASAARTATVVALGALAAAGAWSVRRRMPVTLLFVAGYACIVLVWPFNPSRFVWGVWPLLLLFVTAGAHAAAARPSRFAWPARAALLTAFAWVTVGYAGYEARGIRGSWWSSIARVNSQRIAPAIMWTMANTAPGDVIAAEDEGAIFLYTGRRTTPVFSFTTAQYLRDHSAAENATEGLGPILSAYPVRTVIVGSRKTVDAADFLVNSPTPRLALRADFPGGVAYTVLKQ
ncbi:MAG: hypothetical protein LH467_16540 [Gemmatimonadaceae bacterium]|nr:hypothetical protein [Gemmatimonadaceae bacterium]